MIYGSTMNPFYDFSRNLFENSSQIPVEIPSQIIFFQGFLQDSVKESCRSCFWIASRDFFFESEIFLLILSGILSQVPLEIHSEIFTGILHGIPLRISPGIPTFYQIFFPRFQGFVRKFFKEFLQRFLSIFFQRILSGFLNEFLQFFFPKFFLQGFIRG